MRWIVPALLLLFAFPASAIITATFTVGGVGCEVAGDDCPAPQALFFDATATSCSAGECGTAQAANNAWRSLDFTWDFGDPGNGNWEMGAAQVDAGHDKNVAYGPIAFHVFDSAATYTVTLTVTDGTTTVTDETTVIIDDPDTYFGDANTTCISKAGDFDGCPGAPTQTTDASSTFGTLIGNAITAGDRRILFESDQTWTGGTQHSLAVAGPVQIGVYGATGVNGTERTAVSNPDAGGNDFACTGTIDRWTWVNLDITWTSTANVDNRWFDSRGSSGTCDDMLFYRLSTVRGNKLVTQTSGAGMAVDIFWIGDGQIISGSNIDNKPSFLTISGNVVYAGIDFREENEREIRISHEVTLGPAGPTIIAHNSFPALAQPQTGPSPDELDTGNHNLDIRGYCGDPDAGTGGHRYLLISDNLFRSPTGGINLRDAGDVGCVQKTSDVIIEKNRFDVNIAQGVGFIKNENARRLTVRNNLWELSAVSSQCYRVLEDFADWITDNLYANNSIYSTFDMNDNPFIIVTAEEDFSVCKNNAYWNTATATEEVCPNAATQAKNAGRAAGEEVTITAIPFAGTPDANTTLANWQLNSDTGGGADLLDAGEDIQNVLVDFIGTDRDATPDIGALETQDAVTPSLQGGSISGGSLSGILLMVGLVAIRLRRKL